MSTVAIEQARARGLTVTETAFELGVDLDDVRQVWARMDELAVAPDIATSVVTREQPEIGPSGRLLEPHGSHAAYDRHKRRGQTPCPDCRLGERIYNTERKRRNRLARAGAA